MAIGRNPFRSANCSYEFVKCEAAGVLAPRNNFPPAELVESQVRRAESAREAFRELLRRGFKPDLIIGHPGWGDMMFLRDVWPRATVISYLEYYHRTRDSDLTFDPEFPQPQHLLEYTRIRNNASLLAFVESEVSITPTNFQASTFPQLIRNHLTILHDGVDANLARPDPSSKFALPGLGVLSTADQIVTYSARSLEPYRGFHVFMRSLPPLMRSYPNLRVVILGEDGVSYGNAPPGGGGWCSYLMRELEFSEDARARITFMGAVPYHSYLRALQVSTVHVYLTYPFVTSWSLLEAMACGCSIVGSRTGPVEEFIDDGKCGSLVDFFSEDDLTAAVAELLEDSDKRGLFGMAARHRALSYDFETVTLPSYIDLVGSI